MKRHLSTSPHLSNGAWSDGAQFIYPPHHFPKWWWRDGEAFEEEERRPFPPRRRGEMNPVALLAPRHAESARNYLIQDHPAVADGVDLR